MVYYHSCPHLHKLPVIVQCGEIFTKDSCDGSSDATHSSMEKGMYVVPQLYQYQIEYLQSYNDCVKVKFSIRLINPYFAACVTLPPLQ